MHPSMSSPETASTDHHRYHAVPQHAILEVFISVSEPRMLLALASGTTAAEPRGYAFFVHFCFQSVYSWNREMA